MAASTAKKRPTATLAVPVPVREFLSIGQLAELTPWTPAAIRTMMSRGVFRPGVHYFKPTGAGGRPIFSWRAVVDYIEGRTEPESDNRGKIKLADGTVIDLDKATKEAARLLR